MPDAAPAQSDATHRMAAIDIGTNSIRLVVAEADATGDFRLLDDEKIVTRLGHDMGETGELQPEPMQRAANAIAHLHEIARGYNVDELHAIATCAVREADNGEEFVDLVKQTANLDIRIITAEEEARLAFLSVRNAFDLESTPIAVADIGGGSTEVVVALGGAVQQVYPLPLGAVRLTERFSLGGDVSEDQFQKTKKWLKRALNNRIDDLPLQPQLLFGTGGTFTNLARMLMFDAAPTDDAAMLPATVRGYEMQRADVRHLLDRLRKLPLDERKKVAGLSSDRADIIVAGLLIIDRLMKHLNVNTLRVHDEGIRTGFLHSLIAERFPQSQQGAAAPLDRAKAVRQFAVTCNYEEQHSEQVTKLSLQIFDQLAAQRENADWASTANRDLLEAAAVLHDIGYYINYAKHHKHSYHLIIHSDVYGFTHRELEIIANVARYHRRSVPKSKHANFAKLSESDQELVRVLSGILRVADGLDRTHTQKIESVAIKIKKGVATLSVHADDEPSVDLWGAERKSRLLEEVFDCEASFEWAAPVEA